MKKQSNIYNYDVYFYHFHYIIYQLMSLYMWRLFNEACVWRQMIAFDSDEDQIYCPIDSFWHDFASVWIFDVGGTIDERLFLKTKTNYSCIRIHAYMGETWFLPTKKAFEYNVAKFGSGNKLTVKKLCANLQPKRTTASSLTRNGARNWS